MDKPLKFPIFFIGMPRSGTTVLFEAFSRHPDLAWPSNLTGRFPNYPYLEAVRALLDNKHWNVIGHKAQYGRHRLGNRYLPHPDEAYNFWNHYAGMDLGRSALDKTVPDDATMQALRQAVAAIVRLQRRQRFSAKFTGPPRITYLSNVFPEARFIHVVRDGRAVLHSLLRVGFWRKKGGYDDLFWDGNFPKSLLEEWERSNHDPGVLAAVQWRHIVSRCRTEARALNDGYYTEVKYEDFVANPEATLLRLTEFSDLSSCLEIGEYLKNAPRLINMNHKYAEDFSPEYIELLTRVMQPALSEYGY